MFINQNTFKLFEAKSYRFKIIFRDGGAELLPSSPNAPKRNETVGDRERIKPKLRIVTEEEFRKYEAMLPEDQKIEAYLNRIPDFSDFPLETNFRDILKGFLKALREYDIRNGTNMTKLYADRALQLYQSDLRDTRGYKRIDRMFDLICFVQLAETPQSKDKNEAFIYMSAGAFGNSLIYNELMLGGPFYRGSIADGPYFREEETGYFYALLSLAGHMHTDAKIDSLQHEEYVDYVVKAAGKFNKDIIALERKKDDLTDEGVEGALLEETKQAMERERRELLWRILSPDQYFAKKQQ